MPYMLMRLSGGQTPEQKKKLAEEATAAIAKYVGMPGGTPVVEFSCVDIPADNLSRGGRALGGEAAAYIIVNIMEGTSAENKRALAEEIGLAAAGQLGIAADSPAVTVEIRETNPTRIAHGGKLTLDNPPPGVKL